MTEMPEEPDWPSFPCRGYVGWGPSIGHRILVLDADMWLANIPDNIVLHLCASVGNGERVEIVSMEERNVRLAVMFLKSKVELFFARPAGTA